MKTQKFVENFVSVSLLSKILSDQFAFVVCSFIRKFSRSRKMSTNKDQIQVSSVEARIRKLTEIENNISTALEHASHALNDLGKIDNSTPAKSAVEKDTTKFMQLCDKIEQDLTGQINHLIYRVVLD